MGIALVFHRLTDDWAGAARYSIVRDDKMGPCGYLHVDAGALEIVPLIQAAPKLLAALRAVIREAAPDNDSRAMVSWETIAAARAAIAIAETEA